MEGEISGYISTTSSEEQENLCWRLQRTKFAIVDTIMTQSLIYWNEIRLVCNTSIHAYPLCDFSCWSDIAPVSSSMSLSAADVRDVFPSSHSLYARLASIVAADFGLADVCSGCTLITRLLVPRQTVIISVLFLHLSYHTAEAAPYWNSTLSCFLCQTIANSMFRDDSVALICGERGWNIDWWHPTIGCRGQTRFERDDNGDEAEKAQIFDYMGALADRIGNVKVQRGLGSGLKGIY